MRKDNCMKKPLLEKLVIAQVVKKCPALFGTQKCITLFTRAHHWAFLEADESSPHPQPYFCNIHINNIT
jgi:hypothetical protein